MFVSEDDYNTVLSFIDDIIAQEQPNPFADPDDVIYYHDAFLIYAWYEQEDLNDESHIVRIRFTEDEKNEFYFLLGVSYGIGYNANDVTRYTDYLQQQMHKQNQIY